MINFWVDENLNRHQKMKSKMKKVDVPPELVSGHVKGCACSYCDEENGSWELPPDTIDLNKASAWQTVVAKEAIQHHNPYYSVDESVGLNSSQPVNYQFNQYSETEEKAMFEKYNQEDAATEKPVGHLPVDYVSAGEVLEKWDTILIMEEEEKQRNMLEQEIVDHLEKERMKQIPLKAIVCFYVNVGQTSPDKVDAYLLKYQKRLNVDRWPETHERFWIPVRPPEATRVEVLPL